MIVWSALLAATGTILVVFGNAVVLLMWGVAGWLLCWIAPSWMADAILISGAPITARQTPGAFMLFGFAVIVMTSIARSLSPSKREG